MRVAEYESEVGLARSTRIRPTRRSIVSDSDALVSLHVGESLSMAPVVSAISSVSAVSAVLGPRGVAAVRLLDARAGNISPRVQIGGIGGLMRPT
jgi:hypothetical protein